MEVKAASTLEMADRYLRNGISVIHLKADGSKSPDLSNWKKYQKRLATKDELQRFFPLSDKKGNYEPKGVAAICGLVSGGLEVIDFDLYEYYLQFRKLIHPTLFKKLTIVRTPRGAHVVYRCDTVSGNLKIAMKDLGDYKTRVIAETRGEGGYVATAGSHADTHETKRLYRIIEGPPLWKVNKITESERLAIFQIARSFDETGILERARLKAKRKFFNFAKPIPGVEPEIAKFNVQASWVDLLEPYGWMMTIEGDDDFWTRPGKSRESGHSARVVTTTDGTDVLIVFSSNAGDILQSDTSLPLKLNKFEVYKRLKFGGNRTLAYNSLLMESDFKDVLL